MTSNHVRHGSCGPRSPADGPDPAQAAYQVMDHPRILQAVFDASPDPIFLIDPATMTLTGANRAACLALGYSSDELTGMELNRVAPEASREPLVGQFSAVVRVPGTAATIDTTQRSNDGSESPVRWYLQATETGNGPRIMVFARGSVGERQSCRDESLEAFLLTDVGHDPLTRLPNRRLFERRLQRALNLARRRPDYAFAVLFVDLDGFKTVNDTLGHISGDYVLREVARRLARSVRPRDVVARVGGDEFTVLVDRVRDESDAFRVAQRIQAYTELPLNLDGHVATITASIGIAQSSCGYDRPESILRDADRAMYFAKCAGKSPHVFLADHSPPSYDTRADTAIATATARSAGPSAR